MPSKSGKQKKNPRKTPGPKPEVLKIEDTCRWHHQIPAQDCERGSVAESHDQLFGQPASGYFLRSAFLITSFIDVDAPGLATQVLARLPFSRIRRPVFRLDDI